MSTNHFVLALDRFCNEYDISDTVYSDNAKSFITGVHFMEKVFTSDDFMKRFGVYEIKHIKIPLHSPWQDAVWERLIRTVKNCLRKFIGCSYLDYFRPLPCYQISSILLTVAP